MLLFGVVGLLSLRCSPAGGSSSFENSSLAGIVQVSLGKVKELELLTSISVKSLKSNSSKLALRELFTGLSDNLLLLLLLLFGSSDCKELCDKGEDVLLGKLDGILRIELGIC